MNPPLQRRRLRRLGFVIVAGYFLVGWWPYDFRPANQVRWLPDRAGLQFEERGIAYVPDSFAAPGFNPAQESGSQFTIELWVRADREPGNGVGSLLTFQNPQSPPSLMLCQWQQEIILRMPSQQPLALGWFNEAGVPGALPMGRDRFITVVCVGIGGTEFYLDGKLAKRDSRFRAPPEMLSGQLILGTDATGKLSWAGSVFGLAVYERALTAAEVATNHALWMQAQAATLTNSAGLRALYQFAERSGSHAADTSGQGHRLLIPEKFEPLRRECLIPPWRDLAYRRLNYADIAVNVLGFVPFGVCFYLCRELLTRREKFQHALRVIAAAAIISLTIEIIQSWLPGRVSSLTDLLMNTFGAFLGVLLAAARTRKVKTTTNGHE